MFETINQKSVHIEELSALQFGWQIEFTQLGPTEGKSSVSLMRSDNLGVCHFQFNANYDQRVHAQPDYYSFGLPDPETAGVTVHGREASSGAIIVFPHDYEAYAASPTGFHGYGIQIRAAYFEAIAETVFQMPLRLLVPTTGVYVLTEIQFRHLRRELYKWEQMFASNNSVSKSMLAHHQEAMAIAVLNGLNHSVKTDVTRHLKSDHAIRLVLDYVNNSPSDEITAVELCTLADCSQRWLEQSFKKRFGVTPKAYVKYLRLARLRQDLLSSSHGENQTIIDLASPYGFWHMGQLAADYRKVYGELPSDTLKY